MKIKAFTLRLPLSEWNKIRTHIDTIFVGLRVTDNQAAVYVLKHGYEKISKKPMVTAGKELVAK